MPRHPRSAPGGMVYHVLNRSVGRMDMFRRDADFEAFQRIMVEAQQIHPIRLLSYCVMSNHWHFVVWPDEDGQVTRFFRWLTHTHAMRWRVSHHTVGYGHLYQGRFKSFPVQRDGHFLRLCRYVERNPVAAGAAAAAEEYRWSSLWTRLRGSEEMRGILSEWPVDRPPDWIARVNRPLGEVDLNAVQASLRRGRPLGADKWVARTARQLNLSHTIRAEGRPKKKEKN